MTLDRAEVIALARARAPGVTTARARVGGARALHVGARALAPENPSLMLRAGPRLVRGGDPLLDVNLSILLPFDVSGSRGARSSLAAAATETAEAEVTDAQRLAVARVLDLWVRAAGAAERARLAVARAALDGMLVQSALAARARATICSARVSRASCWAARGLSFQHTCRVD